MPSVQPGAKVKMQQPSYLLSLQMVAGCCASELALLLVTLHGQTLYQYFELLVIRIWLISTLWQPCYHTGAEPRIAHQQALSCLPRVPLPPGSSALLSG